MEIFAFKLLTKTFPLQVNLTELEENEESCEIPPEILIPKYQAVDLASEAAKLKSLDAMDSVPTDRLVKLLNLLQVRIDVFCP